MKKSFLVSAILLLLVAFNKTEAQSTGYLKIRVNQTATIFLDGKNLGDVDADEEKLVEVRIGNHLLKVIKEGYKTHTEDVTINSTNEILERRINLLRPDNFQVNKDISRSNVAVEYGEITIITKLSGNLVAAKVFVDDVFADNAPAKVTKLFVGQHMIRVDYNTFSKTRIVSIQKNKNDVLEIEFLTNSIVNFTSPQTGVSGTIDLTTQISFPSVQNLSVGNHTLRFSKAGMIPAEKKVFFDGESDYNIELKLQSSYPNVTPEEVGRINKQPHLASEFYRPQSKEVYKKKFNVLTFAVGFVLASVATTLVTHDYTIGLAAGLGAALLDQLLVKKSKYSVPDKANIEYNRTEVPRILMEKNREITEYNNETQKLIEERAKTKYCDMAIIITKSR